jgi:hypothetical protein
MADPWQVIQFPEDEFRRNVINGPSNLFDVAKFHLHRSQC